LRTATKHRNAHRHGDPSGNLLRREHDLEVESLELLGFGDPGASEVPEEAGEHRLERGANQPLVPEDRDWLPDQALRLSSLLADELAFFGPTQLVVVLAAALRI